MSKITKLWISYLYSKTAHFCLVMLILWVTRCVRRRLQKWFLGQLNKYNNFCFPENAGLSVLLIVVVPIDYIIPNKHYLLPHLDPADHLRSSKLHITWSEELKGQRPKKNSTFVDIVHVGGGEVNPMSKIEMKWFFDKS